MKKMTMICMASLLLMAASCKKDKKTEMGEDKGFRATTEVQYGNGKTYMDGDQVKWSEGNAILVCSKTCTSGHKFIIDEIEEDGKKAVFFGDGGSPEGFYTAPYTAIYPYNATPNTIVLPATQTYVANGFDDNFNPMAALSSTEDLFFKNICGILELNLQGNCVVKSITISSENDVLCGTGTVDVAKLSGTEEEQQQALTLEGNCKSVTLNCGGIDINTATTFRIVVPAGTLGTTFNVVVTDKDGNEWTRTANSSSILIERSKISCLTATGIEPVIPVKPSAVTIMADCLFCTFTTGGSITVPEGSHNCEFGLVYIEEDDLGTLPTIENGTKVVAHALTDDAISGTKYFNVDLNELVEGKTYIVRAYGLIDGVTYSEETKEVKGEGIPHNVPTSWENGTNPHKFTVADGKKVYFSQANLYYAGNVFGFEPNEVTFGRVVEDAWNAYTDPTHVSHFFWSQNVSEAVAEDFDTEHGHSDAYIFTNSSTDASLPNPSFTANGQTGVWRTLTSDDWVALLGRSGKTGMGKVGNCTNGLIILPDDWTGCPAGLSFVPSDLDDTGSMDYSNNKYTYSQWSKMEEAGAIFLPAFGRRINGSQFCIEGPYIPFGLHGYYWSSNIYVGEDHFNFSYALRFVSSEEINGADKYSFGRASTMRLVRSAD